MYQIKIGDDIIIHQSGSLDPDFLATSATLSWEVNRSGTLEFTLPPNNYALNLNPSPLVKLKNEVIVSRNGKWLWSGRIMDISRNFYNQVTFKCEGWLSVLCDSIVRPDDNIKATLTTETIPTEFTRLIENHNNQIEVNKKFTLCLLGFDETDSSDDEGSSDTPTPSSTPTLRPIHEIALEVINGDWGNGEERRIRLTNAGYDYDEVQTEVNRIWAEEDDLLYSSEETVLGDSSEDGTSNTPSAAEIIACAESYLGTTTGSEKHREIIVLYNSYTPLPRGHRMEYSSEPGGYNDPWCDAFISAIFIKMNAVSLLGGTECYVDSHIAIFQNRGIWLSPGTSPQVGDLITFDWNYDEETDHIGLITSIENGVITTIEGNSGNEGVVANQTYNISDSNIFGYARPQYGSGSGGSTDREDSGSYYQTLDYLMSEFVDNEDIGGYIWVEGHKLYYESEEHRKSHKDENAQPIEFGVNLLDFSHFTDASEVYTCLIPEGKDGLLLNGKKRSSGKSGSKSDTLYGIDCADQVLDFKNLNKKIDVIINSVTRQNDVLDQEFETVYASCQEKNIYIGVYKYTYASSAEQAAAEARRIVEVLDGRSLDWPIFYDLEEESSPNIPALGSTVILEMIEAFRSVVVGAGYSFGIYCNQNWYDNYIPENAKKYDFWIAKWGPNDGTIHEDYKPTGVTNLVGWQYAGDIPDQPGIEGLADLNIFYNNYAKKGSSSGSYDPTVQDWIENEAGVAMFGKIFRQETFDDAEDVNTLRIMATERLNKAIIEATTIEMTAFDLSLLDVDTSMIKLGTYTPVLSPPHGILINTDESPYDFMCTSMSINLCNPGNSSYSFGVNQKTLTSRYNRLFNGLTNGVKGITNYYITEQAATTTKTEIPYSIVGSRISFNRISFYRRDDTVRLVFSCTFLKKVGPSSSIMKFDSSYAPADSQSSTAYDETTGVGYRAMVTADGQLLVVQDKVIAKGDVVTISMSWEVKEEEKVKEPETGPLETESSEEEGGD